MSGDVRSKAIGLGSRLHFVSLNLRMKKVWTRQRSVSKTITLAQNGQMISTTISAVMWEKLMFLLGHTIHSVRNETACNTCCDAKQFLMDSTQAMFQCLKRSGPTRPFFDGRERSVHLIVECDSDWAGELPGQKSASGGNHQERCMSDIMVKNAANTCPVLLPGRACSHCQSCKRVCGSNLSCWSCT